MQGDILKLSIIITCFNEKNTILKSIDEAKKVSVEKEIIVIDNASTDGSRELLSDLKDSGIKIVFQPKNFGYGQSVKTGAELSRGDFIYVHYSDLEYDIECVYRMLAIAEKDSLDVVFGSRLYENKKSPIALIKERPYYAGTIATTFMINLFYGKHFTDIIGTRLYKASSFKKLDIESTGMSFDFEVVSLVCKKGLKMCEVPVKYKPRSTREGKKIKAMDIIPAILTILKLKFLPK